jgi:solute:Na+ symporter, SSS family
VLCLLLLSAIASTHAEGLVSIQTRELAPLADVEAVSRVFVVDGRPVAVGTDSSWMLDEQGNRWQRIDWRPRGRVIGVAADEHRTFVLLADERGDALAGIEEVSFASSSLSSRVLPPPPVSLISAQGAVLGGTLYLAGLGADGKPHFLAVDAAAPRPQWITHAVWQADGETTSTVAQTFAIFVTLAAEGGKGDRLLRWKSDEGWKIRGELPGSVMAGTASAVGQAHVLYTVEPKDAVGASPKLMSFHTITGSWATLAETTVAGARSGTGWKNGMLWERPNADGRGTAFTFAGIQSSKLLLAPLDWIVIAIYLAAMIGMGMYFYLRERRNSTADFFLGGRTIPFWAAGVSLYATNTSSISYIAIPAKSFETNWQYMSSNIITVIGLVFAAVWIVPLLRRLDLMSVFQYLETRFHSSIRMIASALCIAMQVGSRMSVILYLPSLAIATITGIDVVWSIVIMGVFTIIYTAMGGMKAVIWTDFVQLFVKMGGILFAIGFIVCMLDGGAGELLATAAAENKMKLFDFSWDLTKATVWGFLFLVLFDVVLTFPKDQVLMQRVLSTESAKDAGRSVWMFAAIMIPGSFLFYMVGTALFAYYKAHPERLNPLLPIDATFPLFIAAELPLGVRGLIIAGILAAAMATLSSIMNSVATLVSVDFHEKLVKNPDPKVSVRFAEAMTVVTGLVGVGLALILSRYDIHSLFDVSIGLAGLLGGGFAGAYTLGMFTRRANWQGVATGVAIAVTLTTLAWTMNLVHPYFYLPISILLCITTGYCASLLFPAPSPRSLVGLTIYERKSGEHVATSLFVQND